MTSGSRPAERGSSWQSSAPVSHGVHGALSSHLSRLSWHCVSVAELWHCGYQVIVLSCVCVCVWVYSVKGPYCKCGCYSEYVWMCVGIEVSPIHTGATFQAISPLPDG